MSPLRLRLLTAAVFAAGILMSAATGTAAAWVWVSGEGHPAFRFLLPALCLWLLLAMTRLAFLLHKDGGRKGKPVPTDWQSPLAALQAAPRRPPDPATRTLCPDAQCVQEFALPALPGLTWQENRKSKRVVKRIELPEGRFRYLVGSGK